MTNRAKTYRTGGSSRGRRSVQPRSSRTERPVQSSSGQGESSSGPLGALRKHAPDYRIVLVVLLLIIFGGVIGYISSPGLTQTQNLPSDFYTKKQFIAIGIGLVAFAITASVKLDFWRKIIWPAVFAAVLVSIAVRVFGTPIYGAYRWLDVAGISVQAAEIIKFALLVWLADYVARKRQQGSLFSRESYQTIIAVVAAIGLIVGVTQSDLGSTAVMVVMVFGVLFVAGLPMRAVGLFLGGLAAAFILLVTASAYRLDRINTYLNPSSDCQDSGYQVCQALISVGSGGIAGRGLGRSVQAYGYLPEALSDSIFAVVAENTGFIGSAFMVLLFLDLFRRLFNISLASPSEYNRYMVLAILLWLASQAALNIGAMVGIIPLKGITLPLVSFGGTSIIFVLAALGTCFNISRYTDLRRARFINTNGSESSAKKARGPTQSRRYSRA